MILIPFVYFYFKVVIQNFSEKLKKSIFSIFFFGRLKYKYRGFFTETERKISPFPPTQDFWQNLPAIFVFRHFLFGSLSQDSFTVQYDEQTQAMYL